MGPLHLVRERNSWYVFLNGIVDSFAFVQPHTNSEFSFIKVKADVRRLMWLNIKQTRIQEKEGEMFTVSWHAYLWEVEIGSIT